MALSQGFINSSLLLPKDREKVERIMMAALDAVDAGQAVKRYVKRDGDRLQVGKKHYPLDRFERVLAVSVGKASLKMAVALEEIIGARLTGGIIVTKSTQGDRTGTSADNYLSNNKWSIFIGGHPVPDEGSQKSATEILHFLTDLHANDLVFFLISGGGSALMTAPVEPVQLADIRQMTKLLLACGASIQEINTIRKHLDQVKGGGLARRAFPAQVITLILSDVIGNPPDAIASGPTTDDGSTFADAMQIIRCYHLEAKLPECILQVLQAGCEGKVPETVKAGDACLKSVQNVIIASNQQAAEAAVHQARKEGFHSLLLSTYLDGEARETGSFLANVLKQMGLKDQPLKRPACLVAGGETTVTLKGNGKGGRNQELALSCVVPIAGLEKAAIVTLATDGEDGVTGFAGGIATGETVAQAIKAGLFPVVYLERNDSYRFFSELGEWVLTGSTGTNVNDLVFLFTFQ